MSLKLKFHNNWNLTKTKIASKIKLKKKRKYHHNWNINTTEMSPKLKCYQTELLPNIIMSSKSNQNPRDRHWLPWSCSSSKLIKQRPPSCQVVQVVRPSLYCITVCLPRFHNHILLPAQKDLEIQNNITLQNLQKKHMFSTRDVRSNITLCLQEFSMALPLETLSGKGLYLSVHPLSCPNTDTVCMYVCMLRLIKKYFIIENFYELVALYFHFFEAP